jgi:hypothetical protein
MTEAGRRNNDERRYDDSAGLKIRQLLENNGGASINLSVMPDNHKFFRLSFRPNEEEKKIFTD